MYNSFFFFYHLVFAGYTWCHKWWRKPFSVYHKLWRVCRSFSLLPSESYLLVTLNDHDLSIYALEQSICPIFSSMYNSYVLDSEPFSISYLSTLGLHVKYTALQLESSTLDEWVMATGATSGAIRQGRLLWHRDSDAKLLFFFFFFFFFPLQKRKKKLRKILRLDYCRLSPAPTA